MGFFSRIQEIVAPDDGLDAMSEREIEKLASEAYRKKEEPRLRREERDLGTPNWETMEFYTMLRRSLDRYYESQRPGHLRDAHRLGIKNPEEMSTDKLKWAVLSERVRRNRIQDIRASR